MILYFSLGAIFVVNIVLLCLLIFMVKKIFELKLTFTSKIHTELENIQNILYEWGKDYKNENQNQYNTIQNNLETKLEKIGDILDKQLTQLRQENNSYLSQMRQTVDKKFTEIGNNILTQLSRDQIANQNQYNTIQNNLETKLETVRNTLEKQLTQLRQENNSYISQMRQAIDEKLQTTLEKRLSESFKIVGDNLSLIEKGLGEMKSLASGVGDLKNILTNVKVRGTWGELQLLNLLEEILQSNQYEKDYLPHKDGSARVDFAIKMPGNDDHDVFLPIDAKFPKEDYEKIIQAEIDGDREARDRHAKNLEKNIKEEAKKIKQKYLNPPYTTDFAILYVPFESLYAEIVKRIGLIDTLQRDFKIIIAGPTTIFALLNALQVGFRTLAVEKRADEVWDILTTIKKDFLKFGEILDKTQRKLESASKEIESATKQTKKIGKTLDHVQQISYTEKTPR